MKRMTFDKNGRLNSVDGSIFDAWDEPLLEQRHNLLKSDDLEFLKDKTIPGKPDSKFWSLHELGRDLKPLVYSNGKSQADIVKEVADLIKSGNKVIFIHGVCGTGKSSVALNIARIMGRASIVVPIKSLQSQYEEDYTRKKYVLKQNGKKMKIALITGRDNHDSIIRPGLSCADPLLPDNILITEENKFKLFEYYRQNPFIQNKSIRDVKNLRRISIAPSNPYWSPIVPEELELNQLLDARKKRYTGINGRGFIFYHRKNGCSYYDQFQAYLDADVIIFNSKKYELEMSLGRKPETEVDIIDEADSFLDSFSKEFSIDISHIQNSLQHVAPESDSAELAVRKLRDLLENELRAYPHRE